MQREPIDLVHLLYMNMDIYIQYKNRILEALMVSPDIELYDKIV